ncbi:MAG: outer membrane protein [Beijerinckiaceae bacterium]
MRRLLLGSVAITAMSAAAIAADLPARGPAVAPAPVYAAPIFTWSGFYVGLNAGAGFGNRDDRGWRAYTTNSDFAEDAADFNALIAGRHRSGDDAGFTGGAQIGYNWQFGGMVVGLEADVNYLDRNGGSRSYDVLDVAGPGGPYDVVLRGNRGGSNWFGTIRPRIGVAFDRTMLYATGGLAWGGSRAGGGSVTVYQADSDQIVARWEGRRRSGSNWGWTLGAGIEHAFTNNWSAKLEYLYVDLDRGGDSNLVRVSGPTQADQVYFRTGRNSDSFHVIRAGLNFRFGGPASASGPVVAAY